MPNHVQNILTIKGHKNHVEPMLNHLKDGDEEFSFNRIIPMPDELRGTRSPARIVSEAEYEKLQYQKNFREEHPMFSDKGEITQKMSDDWIERFGADNWYDWCVTHWGTKWGAYDVEVCDLNHLGGGQVEVIVRFQTAWSSGAHALAHLAEQYPTIDFYLLYADEDCGSNTGEVWWKNGFTNDSNIPDYSMENYFKCWGGEEDWECVDGEWKWKDEDE